MTLRRLLLRLADRLLPAHLATLDRAHAFVAVHVFATMSRLKVADHLTDEKTTVAHLASTLGCDEDALHRLLRAAAVMDVVAMDEQGRVSAARGTASLRSDDEHHVGEWCQYLASRAHVDAWADLSTSIRTGEPAFTRVNGHSMFEEFERDDVTSSCFSAGLGGLTQAEAAFIVSAYDFPAQGRVCDLAGGQGVLLAEVLRQRPGLRGVLVERAQVLDQARAFLDAAGMPDRVSLVEGDLFQGFSADADVYLLKWVLHDWPDDVCVALLAHVRDTMPASARLVIIEGEQRRDVPDPRFSVIDLQMLVVTEGGRERSVDELTALVSRAGLERTNVTRTPTGLVLLEARPSSR